MNSNPFIFWLITMYKFFSYGFKIALGLLLLGGGLIAGTSHADLILNFGINPSYKPNTFLISFQERGNNYLGALIIKEVKTLANPAQITFSSDGTQLSCTKQLLGYYYNNARGLRLFPIHEHAQEAGSNLEVSGGLFTACTPDGLDNTTIFDLVGVIKYQYNGKDIGSAYYGVNPSLAADSGLLTYQAGAITRKIDNGLNGKMFDSMYSIGTMSSIAPGGGLGDIAGLLSNIGILGRVNLGQSVDAYERAILNINLAGSKTILNTANSEANFANVINTVNKNSALLCRGKDIATSLITISQNESVICLDFGSTFVINSSNFNTLKNKDIVVLNGSVGLDKSVFNLTDTNNHLSLIILNGNLVIDQDTTTLLQRGVDHNGFLTSDPSQKETSGVYIVGNFIVNGLVLGAPFGGGMWNTPYTGIPYKTFILGRLASLNTLTSTSTQRNTQINTLLDKRGQKSSIITTNTYFPDGLRTPSMSHLFSWSCRDDNNTHGTPGVGSGVISSQDTIDAIESSNCPEQWKYPLTVIERNIPSLLLR